MGDAMETVTTVPLSTDAANLFGPMTFWEAVLAEEHRSKPAVVDAKRSGDPLWASVLLIIGAILLVGAGAFIITMGASGAWS